MFQNWIKYNKLIFTLKVADEMLELLSDLNAHDMVISEGEVFVVY
jgi:hypothetical protein